ncbi:MAG: hypothetical protein WCF19_05305 [Chlamydiales bacterium]
MSDVSREGPVGPRETKMYEQEYKHSADLFKRALGQYTQAANQYQQAEFKAVMDKALQVLNETASELVRQNGRTELQKNNAKIAKDYQTFQKDPANPDTLEKLNKDLDKAKKSIT